MFHNSQDDTSTNKVNDEHVVNKVHKIKQLKKNLRQYYINTFS